MEAGEDEDEGARARARARSASCCTLAALPVPLGLGSEGWAGAQHECTAHRRRGLGRSQASALRGLAVGRLPAGRGAVTAVRRGRALPFASSSGGKLEIEVYIYFCQQSRYVTAAHARVHTPRDMAAHAV